MRNNGEQRTASTGALLWLALATFSMGIDGYVLTGLLPGIARDLQVDTAAAGQLMSVFALTGAVAGPMLSAVTGRWERKAVIVVSLAVFIVGNVAVALATTYPAAMAGRVVSAVGGALLSALVSAYVIAKTPTERRGRALSLVMGGWLAATALGVPVGLLLGQQDWRIPLLLVAAVGAVALVGIVLQVPRLHLPPVRLATTLLPLRRGRILAALIVPVALMAASYFCFTYAALIVGVRAGSGLAMVAVLFGYGVVSFCGNIVAGRRIDRRGPIPVATGIVVAVIAATLLGSAGLLLPGLLGAVAAVAWFLAVGAFYGGSGVSLQARLSGMAPESAALLVALNSSAMMLGSALGSATGGAALAAGISPDALVPLSLVFLAVALGVHLIVARREVVRPAPQAAVATAGSTPAL